MGHSSFAISVLANLTEDEKAIALDFADELTGFGREDIAVVAGFWKVQTFRYERQLEYLKQQFRAVEKQWSDLRDIDEILSLYQETHDHIANKIVDYGIEKTANSCESSFHSTGIPPSIWTST